MYFYLCENFYRHTTLRLPLRTTPANPLHRNLNLSIHNVPTVLVNERFGIILEQIQGCARSHTYTNITFHCIFNVRVSLSGALRVNPSRGVLVLPPLYS